MEGDPFYSSGFITAFSHLTVQQQGAFTLTARTFAGDLAELERMLAELDVDAAVKPQTAAAAAAVVGRHRCCGKAPVRARALPEIP